ncbi:MAG: hypothetical protein QNK37_01040 [Acidobacteriota bacterium]|nr:hypothetical protein [Acidobacteriota bacterium]
MRSESRMASSDVRYHPPLFSPMSFLGGFLAGMICMGLLIMVIGKVSGSGSRESPSEDRSQAASIENWSIPLIAQKYKNHALAGIWQNVDKKYRVTISFHPNGGGNWGGYPCRWREVEDKLITVEINRSNKRWSRADILLTQKDGNWIARVTEGGGFFELTKISGDTSGTKE